MSRSWRVISLVVLIAILVGAVCVGVGLVTGGEWDRIYSTLDARYHIDMYITYVGDVFRAIKGAWAPAAADPSGTPDPAVTVEPADTSEAVIIAEPADTPAPEEMPEPAATPAA